MFSGNWRAPCRLPEHLAFPPSLQTSQGPWPLLMPQLPFRLPPPWDQTCALHLQNMDVSHLPVTLPMTLALF